MRRWIATMTVAGCLIIASAAPALAGPKLGCAPTFDLDTVGNLAAYIHPRLVDQSITMAALLDSLNGIDHNGDGNLCMKVTIQQNPNAKWHRVGMDLFGTPTEFMNVVDNNSNASNVR